MLRQQALAEAGGVQEGRGRAALRAAALAKAHAAQPLLARALAQVIPLLRDGIILIKYTRPAGASFMGYFVCLSRLRLDNTRSQGLILAAFSVAGLGI